MKLHPIKSGSTVRKPGRKFRRRGFTLLELLVVITIISILAALGVKTFSYAQVSAAKKKTKAQMEAIKLGLERYKSEFGEYPRVITPRSSDTEEDWEGGNSFRLVGAQALFQALSGDGTDQLDLGGTATTASDGKIDDDEADNLIMEQVDPEGSTAGLVKEFEGKFLLIDGFGNPWQYRNGKAEQADAINATYDLWSYGDAEDFTEGGDDTDVHWIRNW